MNKKTLSMLKREMSHFEGFIILCVIDGILNLLGQGISIWGTKVLGDIVCGDASKFKILVLVIVLYVTAWQGLILGLGYLRKRLLWSTEITVREKLLKQIFDSEAEGLSVDIYINELEKTMQIYNEYFRYSIIGLCAIVGSIIMGGILDWRLLLISFVLGGIIFIINILISGRISAKANKLWDKYNNINKKIRKMFKCFELIYTFPKNDLFIKDFKKMNEEIAKNRENAMGTYAKIDAVFPIVFFLFQVSFLGIGFFFMSKKILSLGIVLGSLQSANIIMGNINYLGGGFSVQQEKITAANHIADVLSAKKESSIVLKEEMNTLCSVVDVSYYNDDKKYILKNLFLDLNKGDFIRICGKNGAGKSTLLHILLGLKKAKSGNVMWKKMDSEESFESYREKNIGYVPQNPYIKKEWSLEENIVNKGETINTDRLQKLICDFGLQNFKRKMSVGTVSGGELKKICIVRALYKESAILILDEPFVNLDAHSINELKLWLEMENEKGVTIVMISHKNNIKFKNEKLVFLKEEGRIEKV